MTEEREMDIGPHKWITRKLDKKKLKKYVQTLDGRQQGILIPQEKETNEVVPTTFSAFYLENSIQAMVQGEGSGSK